MCIRDRLNTVMILWLTRTLVKYIIYNFVCLGLHVLSVLRIRLCSYADKTSADAWCNRYIIIIDLMIVISFLFFNNCQYIYNCEKLNSFKR